MNRTTVDIERAEWHVLNASKSQAKEREWGRLVMPIRVMVRPSSWLWRSLGTGMRCLAGLVGSLVTEVPLVPFVSGRPRSRSWSLWMLTTRERREDGRRLLAVAGAAAGGGGIDQKRCLSLFSLIRVH